MKATSKAMRLLDFCPPLWRVRRRSMTYSPTCVVSDGPCGRCSRHNFVHEEDEVSLANFNNLKSLLVKYFNIRGIWLARARTYLVDIYAR